MNVSVRRPTHRQRVYVNSHSWKRIVAREWLLFLGCFVVAGALGLWVMIVEDDFYPEAIVFLGILIYVSLSLLRSVVWAVKTLRRNHTANKD